MEHRPSTTPPSHSVLGCSCHSGPFGSTELIWKNRLSINFQETKDHIEWHVQLYLYRRGITKWDSRQIMRISQTVRKSSHCCCQLYAFQWAARHKQVPDMCQTEIRRKMLNYEKQTKHKAQSKTKQNKQQQQTTTTTTKPQRKTNEAGLPIYDMTYDI